MNPTSNLSKHFNNTPHQRRTRLSLAARAYQQQQENDLNQSTGPHPSYGRAHKRSRQTNFTGDRVPARQFSHSELGSDPLSIFLPQLEQLSQSMNALENNFQHLGGIDRALNTFNDAFDTFLRAITVNAQCITFPEAPNALSFKRKLHTMSSEASNPLVNTIYNPDQATTQVATASNAELANPSDSRYLAELSYVQDVSGMLNDTFASSEDSARSKIPIRKKRAAPPPKPKPLPIKKMIEELPLRYREGPHRDVIESIIKALHTSVDGLYIHDIIKEAGNIARHRAIEYTNALVHSKLVLKTSRKGFLYQLDPVKYPPPKVHRRR